MYARHVWEELWGGISVWQLTGLFLKCVVALILTATVLAIAWLALWGVLKLFDGEPDDKPRFNLKP